MTDTDPGRGAGGPASGPSTSQASPPTGQAPEGRSPGDTAHVTAADIKQKISDDVRSASDFVKQEVSSASDKTKDAADERKNFIAGKMSSVALAMEKVAAELEQGDNREVGRLTRNLGSSMRKFSEDIQDRSLGEIAGMAEDFGRRQPLAFLGVAAIAGLAVSRFLIASAPLPDTASTQTTTSGRIPPGQTSAGLAPSQGAISQASMEDRFNG
ncbi:nutrient deprivation-induced protein [Neorhizobium sp. DT-125]|uniref:nutrient deprivation-induced protein n=1 Tax=Neorhizobium sp. DT-125 TaxID=3396163 RepID=UPI003F197B68